MPSNKKLIVITGPTAVGKTALSIHLAQQLDTEIISCDSRQFYKEMSIGTAKPDHVELSQVKHHLINNRSVVENYNVGAFERDALEILNRLFSTKDVAIMTGGSGLYIRALCNGLDTFPEVKEEAKTKVKTHFEENGIAGLQEQLKELDPTYYEQVDLENPQRIMRALEVCISSGKPYTSFKAGQYLNQNRPFQILKIVLNRDREELYNRINQRVDQMIAAGLLNEVVQLYPYRSLNALNTVGYQEFFDAIDGRHTFEKAVELLKRNTRRFAKRQLTWFRKEKDTIWIEADEHKSVFEEVNRFLK